MKLPPILFTPNVEPVTSRHDDVDTPLDNMPNLASQFLYNIGWRKLFAQYFKGMKNKRINL